MAQQFTSQPWMQGNNESESLNLSGMLPEDAIRLQKLSRKQQLANYLLQKALTGQQGGMAGKFYVAPSWTQGLAQLAEAGLGTYMNKNIDNERALMAQEIEKRRQGEIDAYQQATSPKAVQPEMPVDSTLVPNTFDIEKLQPDQQRFQARDANATAYANTAAPGEVETGALTDNISKIGSVVSDPQMAAPERAIPVGDPTMQAPDPLKARQATLQAMMSQDPRVAQAVRFMEQQKAAQDELNQKQTLTREQNELNRQNQINIAEARMDQTLLVAAMSGMGQKEIAQLRTSMEEKIEKMRQEGQDRRDNVQPLVSPDPTSSSGYSYYDARTSKKIREAPKPAAEVKAETDKAKTGKKGQLPTAALKMQQDELNEIGMASGLNADLAALGEQVRTGKLQLGFFKNIIGGAKNIAGLSDEQSRNLSTFKATLEKQRNDSLRLNKGTQTEGDAVRAWNEIMENINDGELVTERLAEIQKLNDRAVAIRKLNVDSIRRNYDVEPYDFSDYTNQPAAVGAKKEAEVPLDDLLKKYKQ